MHILLKSQIFRSGQSHFRCTDTLYGRVVCQVYEYDRTVDRACRLKVIDKVFRVLERNTDSGKNNGEFGIRAAYLRLTRNLYRKVCVGQTGSGENRQLLPANQRIQAVNRGNARLNELSGVFPCRRINGRAVDVQTFFGNDFGAAVHGLAHAIEYASQNVRGNAEIQALAKETHFTFCKVDTCRAFKQLNQRRVAAYFQHPALSDFAVGKFDFAQLVKFYAFHTGNQHQRAGNFLNRSVFLYHNSSASFLMSSCTSLRISVSISS